MAQKLRMIYVYRLRAGLTQEAIAKLVGVPQESISNWENGLKIPSEHLMRLWEVFSDLGVLPEGTPLSALDEEFNGVTTPE